MQFSCPLTAVLIGSLAPHRIDTKWDVAEVKES